MKTFEVEVIQVAYKYKTIQVEADSQQEANELALQKASDHEFTNTKHHEYVLSDHFADLSLIHEENGTDYILKKGSDAWITVDGLSLHIRRNNDDWK